MIASFAVFEHFLFVLKQAIGRKVKAMGHIETLVLEHPLPGRVTHNLTNLYVSLKTGRWSGSRGAF